MLGMINPEKNAQHTAESMPIRQQDILTLVKANATNHPQDLQTLKALRDNPNSNISSKNLKRINALIVAIEGDFQNCHQLVVSLGKKYNTIIGFDVICILGLIVSVVTLRRYLRKLRRL